LNEAANLSTGLTLGKYVKTRVVVQSGGARLLTSRLARTLAPPKRQSVPLPKRDSLARSRSAGSPTLRENRLRWWLIKGPAMKVKCLRIEDGEGASSRAPTTTGAQKGNEGKD